MFALIVPTMMAGLAPDIHALAFWRFVQGLTLPPIFAVTVAYIGEEWPRGQALGVTGLYTSATSLSGFFGRFATGVIADAVSWRAAFIALAVMTSLFAAMVAVLLPRERHFVRSAGLRGSVVQMLRHLRNPQLLAVYAIGFGVLFTFVATFTYINFLLAAPPFRLSPTFLGLVFVVYLGGSLVAPLTGRAVARFGRRPLVIFIIGLWLCGVLITLIPQLLVILAGLTISATCGLLCQSISTGIVAVSADQGHSSAVGLYVTFYYIGGSIGGVLPGLAWSAWGWPGCVAAVAVMLGVMALIVWRYWREAGTRAAR
jgi:predicted MFS family arabinose efflux permease